MTERRPRQYAQTILKEPDRVERKRMLYRVPAHLRAMVKHHVVSAWGKR